MFFIVEGTSTEKEKTHGLVFSPFKIGHSEASLTSLNVLAIFTKQIVSKLHWWIVLIIDGYCVSSLIIDGYWLLLIIDWLLYWLSSLHTHDSTHCFFFLRSKNYLDIIFGSQGKSQRQHREKPWYLVERTRIYADCRAREMLTLSTLAILGVLCSYSSTRCLRPHLEHIGHCQYFSACA